jgi:hypothetical protein
MEASRSMMQVAKMENKFWAETMATLCYLQNITPTKAIIKKTLGKFSMVKNLSTHILEFLEVGDLLKFQMRRERNWM